jgi:hypothetical protein
MLILNSTMTFWNLLVGQVMLYTGLSSTVATILVAALTVVLIIAVFMTAKWVYKKIKTKLLA